MIDGIIYILIFSLTQKRRKGADVKKQKGGNPQKNKLPRLTELGKALEKILKRIKNQASSKSEK